jgi:glycine C-acetyltransferase
MSASKTAGTFKTEKILTSPMNNTATINGKNVITMSSNNYLQLGNHPEVVQAAQDALAKYGFGSGAARSIIGTNDLHLKLEQQVADWLGTEATIVYNSCLDANTGFFDSLLHKEDAIISDTLNHASIIDGIRLSKASRYRYKHLDMGDLEEK